jgi:hypothetical protein
MDNVQSKLEIAGHLLLPTALADPGYFLINTSPLVPRFILPGS